MQDEHDHSPIEGDRADRALIEQAAAQLCQGAIRASTNSRCTCGTSTPSYGRRFPRVRGC